MKGLNIAFIFTLAIVLLTEPVTSLSAKKHHERDDWWMLGIRRTPKVSHRPTMTEHLVNFTIALGKYIPDFSSAFWHLFPIGQQQNLDHSVRDQNLLKRAKSKITKVSTDLSKKMNAGCSRAKRFVKENVVRILMKLGTSRITGLSLGVLIGLGIFYYFRPHSACIRNAQKCLSQLSDLPLNPKRDLSDFVGMPKLQKSTGPVAGLNNIPIMDLSDSFENPLITEWRNSNPLEAEGSDGEESPGEDREDQYD